MATITISVDENVKRSFSAFCNDVGLSASSLINVFMVTTARERRVPFTIAAPSVTRDEIAELESDIATSRREFAEGKGVPLDKVSQNMMTALDKRSSLRMAQCPPNFLPTRNRVSATFC